MTDKYRILLFFCLCIPVRILLLIGFIFASRSDTALRYIFAGVALFVSLGFLQKSFVYNFSERLYQATGWERWNALYLSSRTGGFGGTVWWNIPRLVHACLLLTYAICSLCMFRYAWIFPILDISVAILAGILHYAFGLF